MYSSWVLDHDRHNILPFWVISYPFVPLNHQNIKILKKKKKNLEIIFSTCVPQMKIIWCIVPEIWTMTVRIFYFGLLYSNNLKNQIIDCLIRDIIILHRRTINENHIMYGSRDMERTRQFFLILDHFLPFYRHIHCQFDADMRIDIQIKFLYYPLMLYTVPEILCVTDVIFIFHFVFFPFYPSLPPKKNQN